MFICKNIIPYHYKHNTVSFVAKLKTAHYSKDKHTRTDTHKREVTFGSVIKIDV